MKWLNSLSLWPLEEHFLKAFPAKSIFLVNLNVQKRILFQACWVHIYIYIYTPLHTQKQSLQKIVRIQLYGSYDRCVLIEMGRLMITNCSFDNRNCALQERKGRKGKKEGIRGGNEGKEKERIDRRKGNDKWRKKDIRWVFKGIRAAPLAHTLIYHPLVWIILFIYFTIALLQCHFNRWRT